MKFQTIGYLLSLAVLLVIVGLALNLPLGNTFSGKAISQPSPSTPAPPACYPFLIKNNQPFTGQNQNNPQWRWLLDDLTENSATFIQSPEDIAGPKIGIKNAIQATLDAQTFHKEILKFKGGKSLT